MFVQPGDDCRPVNRFVGETFTKNRKGYEG